MNSAPLNRRDLLKRTSHGFGYLAFAALAREQALRGEGVASPLAPKPPHFTPKAKRVIFLCMQGAPSHVDLLDYKPKLIADSGKNAPSIAGRNGQAKLMKSPWKFSQQGRSGLWMSELLPHLAKQADELCVINSMTTDLPAHPQAFTQLHTGTTQFVRPSLGAWTLYGLGTANENLPGFITIIHPATPRAATAAPFCQRSISAQNSEAMHYPVVELLPNDSAATSSQHRQHQEQPLHDRSAAGTARSGAVHEPIETGSGQRRQRGGGGRHSIV